MKTICYTGSDAEHIFNCSQKIDIKNLFSLSSQFFTILFYSNLLLCFYNVFLNFSFYKVILFSSLVTVSLLGCFFYNDIRNSQFIVNFGLTKPRAYEAKYRVMHYEVYKSILNESGYYVNILKVKLEGIENSILVLESEFKNALNREYVTIEGRIRMNRFRRIIFIDRLLPVHKRTHPEYSGFFYV